MHYGCIVHTCISSFCDISSLLCPYLYRSVQAVSPGFFPQLWYSWFSSSWHVTQQPWTWVLLHMQWSGILEWYRACQVCLTDRILCFYVNSHGLIFFVVVLWVVSLTVSYGYTCIRPHLLHLFHILLLLQSALQPLVGFWPAQLSLSLLSRKVFTECCCQQHIKPPAWRTSD